MPWNYWQPTGEGLSLYHPRMCHGQYADLWSRRASGTLFDLFTSNTNSHTIDASKPGVDLVSLGGGHMHGSLPFLAVRVNRFEQAIDEPYCVQLLRDKSGAALQQIDAAKHPLTLIVRHLEKVTTIEVRIFAYAKSSPIVEASLDRSAVTRAMSKAPDWRETQMLELDLTKVLPASALATLDWKGSPYQLVASANGDPLDRRTEPNAWSWTYFHVPSAWDVNTTEAVAKTQVMLLEDDLRTLKTVGGADIKPRSSTNDQALQWPAGTEVELNDFFVSLIKDPISHYSAHEHNVMWQLSDGSYFAATSWASIIVLERNDTDDTYQARSILTHGGRHLYIVTQKVQQELAELSTRPFELINAYLHALWSVRNAKHAYEGNQNSTYEGKYRGAEAKAAAVFEKIRAHQPTLDKITLYAGRTTHLEPSTKLDLRIEVTTHVKRSLEGELATVPRPYGDLARQEATREIPGDRSFEGPRGDPSKGTWQQFMLPPGMTINKAVTQGISSCAGGVTFSTDRDDRPRVLILWHIDFPPSVPIKTLVEQAWPDVETRPPFKTIAYVFPDSAELNKYRKEMLYPSDIRDKSQTVFMMRGDHLGCGDFILGTGSEYFGLDVSTTASVDLIFTHDLHKRTPLLQKRKTRTSDTETSITLVAFERDVFGGYRYPGVEVAPGDLDAMRRYTAAVSGNAEEVKNDKLSKCEVCRLPGVGAPLFAALSKVCLDVLDLPCLLLGERVAVEFADSASTVVESSRWDAVSGTKALPVAGHHGPRDVIGIYNTLNQCYINSVLQLCAVLEVEDNYYLGNGAMFDAAMAGAVNTFIDNLGIEAGAGRYIDGGTAGNADVVYTTQDTTALRTRLAIKCGWASIDTQEDAAEALTKVLECYEVNRGLDASPAGLAALDGDEGFAAQTPTQLHFVVAVRTTYAIAGEGQANNPAPHRTWYRLSEGGSITRLECHNLLHLSIDATSRTMQQVLERTFDRTYGDHELETNDCIHAGRYHRDLPRIHERIRLMARPPDHLLVQLKRFDNSGQKIATNITYPDALILQGRHYALRAFILHIGQTARSGHYITYIDIRGTWYKLDDHRVTSAAADKGTAVQQAYIYYYVAI